MKNKKIIISSIIVIVIVIFGIISICTKASHFLVPPVEKLNTDSNDPRLEFETVHKELLYVDIDDWFVLNLGYKYPENTFINDQEQLEKFFQNSGIYFDSSNIDFNEYMLLVEGGWDIERYKTYDIYEISYNSKVLDVLTDFSNSETYVNHDKSKKMCYYVILKIKKSEFPYEPRDYLRHQKHM